MAMIKFDLIKLKIAECPSSELRFLSISIDSLTQTAGPKVCFRLSATYILYIITYTANENERE